MRKPNCNALAAGASDFLAKPFSTTELHVRVKNLVDSHDYQRQLARQNQILEATLEQLKETETQLVQTEKLASLGRMSAGNHSRNQQSAELRQTATHMTQAAIRTICRRRSKRSLRTRLKDIEEGIDRVRVIVSDLRSFTHPNTEIFEDVAIATLITSTLRFLSHEWKDKVEIVQNYEETAHGLGQSPSTHSGPDQPAPELDRRAQEEGTLPPINLVSRSSGLADENLPF